MTVKRPAPPFCLTCMKPVDRFFRGSARDSVVCHGETAYRRAGEARFKAGEPVFGDFVAKCPCGERLWMSTVSVGDPTTDPHPAAWMLYLHCSRGCRDEESVRISQELVQQGHQAVMLHVSAVMALKGITCKGQFIQGVTDGERDRIVRNMHRMDGRTE